jgi:hypothetical protein
VNTASGEKPGGRSRGVRRALSTDHHCTRRSRGVFLMSQSVFNG